MLILRLAVQAATETRLHGKIPDSLRGVPDVLMAPSQIMPRVHELD